MVYFELLSATKSKIVLIVNMLHPLNITLVTPVELLKEIKKEKIKICISLVNLVRVRSRITPAQIGSKPSF
jgi:hypothetical protein